MVSENDVTLPCPLVSTQWLADNLGVSNLMIIDASWYLPAMNRDGRAEYLAGHIPGAVFFDIDAIADHSTSLPHMLPDEASFAAAAGGLGVGDESRVVVYDGHGLFSAPRVWWTFRTFGLRQVAVLDGGLPKWRAEGRAVESGEAARRPRHFTARLDRDVVKGFEEVRAALEFKRAQVFDARPADRFFGRAPEPRPGLQSGHMPGASSLPASDLIADGRLKSPTDIIAAFEAAGVDWTQPVITSCGSGVSAAILTLALERAGKPPGGLYDGSWSEWAARKDAPIITG